MTRLKIFPILLALFSFLMIGCSASEKEDIDSGKIIISHVTDSHSWHLFDINKKDDNGQIVAHPVAVNLPVILLDQGHLVCFSSKQFHHGHAVYQGKHHTYALIGGGLEKEEVICVEKNSSDNAAIDREHFKIGDELYSALLDEDGNVMKPLDFSITKTAAAILVAVTLLIVIILSAARQYKKRGPKSPHGLQALVEVLVLHVRDDIVEPILGKNTDRFLPYLLTLFFFIIFCNVLGLIPIFPAGANITGNIAVTAILALITFLITNINGNKHYWKDIFNTPGVPAWLKVFPLMPVVEVVGVFTKPIVLMIRLFANMTAGHIVILGFIVIIFILSNALGMAVGGVVSVVSIVFSVFISLLECLVAYIQAFVFTMLSALYISMAVEEPETH